MEGAGGQLRFDFFFFRLKSSPEFPWMKFPRVSLEATTDRAFEVPNASAVFEICLFLPHVSVLPL